MNNIRFSEDVTIEQILEHILWFVSDLQDYCNEAAEFCQKNEDNRVDRAIFIAGKDIISSLSKAMSDYEAGIAAHQQKVSKETFETILTRIQISLKEKSENNMVYDFILTMLENRFSGIQEEEADDK